MRRLAGAGEVAAVGRPGKAGDAERPTGSWTQALGGTPSLLLQAKHSVQSRKQTGLATPLKR